MPKACFARWPCPLPRRIERVRVSIASPLMQPSPNGRRVGIRIVTFEACSGFTHVTARRIAQPPKAAFVTRLQPSQLPDQAARQLPDQSTTLWVDSSSTDDSRLRGARPFPDIEGCHFRFPRESTRSRAQPMTRLATGFIERFFKVNTPTGMRASGRSIGRTFSCGRLGENLNNEAGKIVRKRPVAKRLILAS